MRFLRFLKIFFTIVRFGLDELVLSGIDDRRVRFLRKRLEGMVIVDPQAEGIRRDANRVYFGAWVQIESAAGDLRWHRLVGPDEFDMDEGYVSMDSPLGRSLLGKRLDDEFSVELPGGAATMTVTAISYALKPPECS